MVLATIIEWYGLRTVIHTYLFPNAFDMRFGHDSYPLSKSLSSTTARRSVSLEDEVSRESHCNHDQKPTTLLPIDKPYMDGGLNFPNMHASHKTSPSLTHPSPKTQDGISMEYNRAGTTDASQNSEPSEITSGWFDIIHDDEDSESCCSSTGIGDGYDCSDENQWPQPLETDSFAYDFFVKGVMGFLCEILEGGGRWGERGVRSTT